MAITYKKIASVTVGSGGAADIEFTSIPNIYTDLVVKVSARSTASVDARDLLVQINGNVNSVYTNRGLYGFSGGAGSFSQTAGFLASGQIPAANSTLNTYSTNEIYIPNYAGSTNKSLSVDAAWDTNSSTLWQLNLFAQLFANTNVITSIKLYLSASGVFSQYSTATLYGILKA